MRLIAALFIGFALISHWGCRTKDAGSSPRPDAPTGGAPRSKVAIEAPAKGSAKDAKVSSVGEAQSTPPVEADLNRKYEKGVTERDLGLPFYPGSEEVRPGSRVVDSTGIGAQSFRRTRSPVRDVIAFYRKRLDVVLHEIVDATSSTLVGEAEGRRVTVVATRRSAWTEVSIFTKRPVAR